MNSAGVYNRAELPRLVVEKGPRPGVGQSSTAPAPAKKRVPQSNKKKTESNIVPSLTNEKNNLTFTIREPLVVTSEAENSGRVAGLKINSFRSFKYKRRQVNIYKHKFH